ncbi:MAG TPA: MarR family transcriptional regulator [Phnomibacter sp.]|nr:MarR family transcriptional regulator [Phnomibacter sp.]
MTLEEAIKTSGFQSQRHKAAVNLMFTAYQLKSRIAQVLKNYALTPEQYNVLRILKGSHPSPLCVRDIACRMIERNSNVPRIADRLELKKLVKRTISPEDRRETLMQITPAGLNLLEIANKVIESTQDEIVAISESQAAELNQLLELMMKE